MSRLNFAVWAISPHGTSPSHAELLGCIVGVPARVPAARVSDALHFTGALGVAGQRIRLRVIPPDENFATPKIVSWSSVHARCWSLAACPRPCPVCDGTGLVAYTETRYPIPSPWTGFKAEAPVEETWHKPCPVCHGKRVIQSNT